MPHSKSSASKPLKHIFPQELTPRAVPTSLKPAELHKVQGARNVTVRPTDGGRPAGIQNTSIQFKTP